MLIYDEMYYRRATTQWQWLEDLITRAWHQDAFETVMYGSIYWQLAMRPYADYEN